MPQDRLRHQRAGHSQKLTALSDFEYRVWDQYQLSADDFGIMRCSPLPIQAGNDALAQRAQGAIQKALDRLIEIDLVRVYQHQGGRYIFDPVWQYFQKVEYPKQTINPAPPDDVLALAHPLTIELFRQCFGKPKARFRKGSVEESPTVRQKIDEQSPLGSVARAKAEANGIPANPSAASLRQMPRLLEGPHPHHAICGRPCMHGRQFRELVSKLGGDQRTAEQRIEAFAAKVQAKYEGQPIPTADEFKFWNAEYDAEFGGKKPAQTSTVPGADETRARMQKMREQAQ